MRSDQLLSTKTPRGEKTRSEEMTRNKNIQTRPGEVVKTLKFRVPTNGEKSLKRGRRIHNEKTTTE